jgi:hypothetical protein
MKNVLVFGFGFVAGIIATIIVGISINNSNKPNDGLLGLTVFPEKGECLTTTSKNKSCEIAIYQVIAPNAALGNISYYSDKRIYGNEIYRDYDIGNDVIVLLINYDNKTYYDDQKIDISNKCARQIGTYQYTANSGMGKTVPAVVIE